MTNLTRIMYNLGEAFNVYTYELIVNKIFKPNANN